MVSKSHGFQIARHCQNQHRKFRSLANSKMPHVFRRYCWMRGKGEIDELGPEKPARNELKKVDRDKSRDFSPAKELKRRFISVWDSNTIIALNTASLTCRFKSRGWHTTSNGSVRSQKAIVEALKLKGCRICNSISQLRSCPGNILLEFHIHAHRTLPPLIIPCYNTQINALVLGSTKSSRISKVGFPDSVCLMESLISSVYAHFSGIWREAMCFHCWDSKKTAWRREMIDWPIRNAPFVLRILIAVRELRVQMVVLAQNWRQMLICKSYLEILTDNLAVYSDFIGRVVHFSDQQRRRISAKKYSAPLLQ